MSFPQYPEYKDSGVEWLGEVPAHWEVPKLKHLVRIRNGRDYKAVEVDSGGYPVIGSGGEFSRADSYLYKGKSVLLGRKGTIDKPLYIDGPFWTVDTMFYTELTHDVNGRFLFHYATCFRFDQYSTNTALPSMAQEDLANIQLAVPEIDEQASIAAFLDKETARIDALIDEQKRLIELLKEKRQAVISHAVTKGLDPDVPMKDSGVEWLGEVPAHWHVVALKRIVEFQRGHDLPAESREPGEIPVISSGGYSGFHSAAMAKAPGIVTGRYGSIGKFTLVQEDYWPLNTALYSTKLNGNQASYVWYLLHSLSAHFLLNSLKSAVPGVDRNDIHVVMAARAPFKEQDLIVEHLDVVSWEIDNLIQEAHENILLLQERRSALISAAVTGKIDVRSWKPGQAAELPMVAESRATYR